MKKKDERNVALRRERQCFIVLVAAGGLLVLLIRLCGWRTFFLKVQACLHETSAGLAWDDHLTLGEGRTVLECASEHLVFT
jgi:hypothetical protein